MKAATLAIVAIISLAAAVPLLMLFTQSQSSAKQEVVVSTLPFSGSTSQSSAGRVLWDVTYCKTDDVSLKLDLYLPEARSGQLPVAVYVHGGGWVSGDKRDGTGAQDVPALVRRGYLVAAVNYRLGPQYKFSAQIEDVKCVIRFLRANAPAYGLNPNRVGAWGGSAGGHLVSLLGLSDETTGWDVGQYLDQPSQVHAVVDYFGPADLTVPYYAMSSQILRVFGSKDNLAKASPVTYASASSPPFLIFQGTMDSLVPPEQSQRLYERLTAAGVTSTLVMVQNAGHGFVPLGGPINPSRIQITTMMVDFFDRYLRSSNLSQEAPAIPAAPILDFVLSQRFQGDKPTRLFGAADM